MNLSSLNHFCLSLPGTSCDYPFDENVKAFRVSGKIFALLDDKSFDTINLKCDPELALQWRNQFPDVQPGYHMNKKHWNTVQLHGNLSDERILEMIQHSYDMVIKSMPKSMRPS